MDNLSSILPPIRRHWFPALLAFASVMGGAALYLLTTPKVYEASVRLSVENPQGSVSPIGQELAQPAGKVSNSTDPMATQVEMVKSQRVLKSAIARVAETVQQPPAEMLPEYWELGRELRVSVVPATNILEIRYESEYPEFTAAVLNQVAAEVVAQSAEDIRNEASAVRQFLEQQIPQERQKLQALENLETQFRQQTRIVDVNTQTSQLLNNLSQLQDQAQALSGQLQEVRTREALLRQMTGFESPEFAYVASRVGQDPELSELEQRLTNIEAQVIETRAKYVDSHPQVQALLQQRNNFQTLYSRRLAQFVPGGSIAAGSEAKDALSRDLISRYVLNNIEGSALTNRLLLVEQNRRVLESQLATVPAQREQLARIERDRQEVQNNLDLLQQKLQEARIAEAQLLSNVRPISRANTPGEPSGPKVPVVIVLATAAASVLAGSVVLLLESLNNTVRSAHEIESATDAPVLGVLPRQSGRLSRAGSSALESFLDSPAGVEPYRRLLKNIELQSSKAGAKKVVIVSSTTPGEGVSDVVARLAAVSSMLSRRTLVIDANLLDPLQGELLEAPSAVGLTHVIEGQVELADAVQQTSIPGLDVLTCGELVPRPSTVIESAAMQHLLRDVTNHYDFVLVDTPPASLSSDAVSLGSHSDGLLVVVRPNLTVKESMLATMNNLRTNQIPVAGIAVNETRALPYSRGSGLKFGQAKDMKLLGADRSFSRS